MRSATATKVTAPNAGRPWASGAISVLALFAWIFPRWQEYFLYDRALIASGQWWRIWSGHVAHHGLSHLFWNLAVFIPAGIWLERRHALSARLFLGFAPIFISIVLLCFDPSLKYYAGLSGVTMGVLTLLSLWKLRGNSGEPKWFWATLLVLIVAKMGAEFARDDGPIFAGLPEGVRNVPLAHLAGAIGALLLFLGSAWTIRKSGRSDLV